MGFTRKRGLGLHGQGRREPIIIEWCPKNLGLGYGTSNVITLNTEKHLL